ncbi:DUF4097 family beta strand repeat-containing protein [Streptosporangium algeriense]|uniref:DUF4097 family beta strand repeat-containing protein n=1 Tax=Streptosporangium algeriense TaxID=1682748 RepID=A0ABW3DHD5_9ACTN
MTMTTRTLFAPLPADLVFEMAMPDGAVEVIADDIDHVEITLSTDATANSPAARAIADATLTTRGSVVRLHVPAPEHDTMTVIGRNTVVTGLVIDADMVFLGDGIVVTGGGGVRAVIRLPRGSSLWVETRSAQVHTRGLLDTLDFESVSGDLIADTVRSLTTTTTSGDVRAGVADGVSVSTKSGDIRIGRTSVAVLDSTSGDIQIADFGGSGRLTTTSGDITVTATRPGRLCATSRSGDVTVSATADLAALGTGGLIVDACSTSGDVRTPRPASTGPRGFRYAAPVI